MEILFIKKNTERFRFLIKRYLFQPNGEYFNLLTDYFRRTILSALYYSDTFFSIPRFISRISRKFWKNIRTIIISFFFFFFAGSKNFLFFFSRSESDRWKTRVRKNFLPGKKKKRFDRRFFRKRVHEILETFPRRERNHALTFRPCHPISSP